MKLFNCLCLCCTCGYWCEACCGWLCVLSVCGTALKHLDKRKGCPLILAILCFCCTPFLQCAGCANFCLSFSSAWKKIMDFCDTKDGVAGFAAIVIPENPGKAIQPWFGWFDKCCKA